MGPIKSNPQPFGIDGNIGRLFRNVLIQSVIHHPTIEGYS